MLVTATQCQCTRPGFCRRHLVTRTETTFRFCSQHQQYFDLWESKPKGNVCSIKSRLEKVRLRVAKSARLKSWIKLFRANDDQGIGDTAKRILESCKSQNKLVTAMLVTEMKSYSCKLDEAASLLNELYPYER